MGVASGPVSCVVRQVRRGRVDRPLGEAALTQGAREAGGVAPLELLQQPVVRGDRDVVGAEVPVGEGADRKSTRLNSSHVRISYAVFCLKKKKRQCVHKPTPKS